MGTVTLMEGVVHPGGGLVVSGLHVPLPADEAAPGARLQVAVRPEDVDVVEPGASGAAAGVVTDCAYLGHGFRLRVRLDGGPEVVAQARAAAVAGQTVWLRARAASVIPA
jgi:ABC-type Fe3+/spermidine/putrescine transport system ATPase subunit